MHFRFVAVAVVLLSVYSCCASVCKRSLANFAFGLLIHYLPAKPMDHHIVKGKSMSASHDIKLSESYFIVCHFAHRVNRSGHGHQNK